MTDTLGKIIPRVPAATSSTSNLFASARALSAGAGTIFLVSDLNHLMTTTATGVVFANPGAVGFYRGPNGGTLSNPPRPEEIMWTPPGPDPGALNFRAQFRVDPLNPSTLPTLRLRCWVKAPPSGTESVGVFLGVGVFVAPTMRYTSTVVTNTSGEDVTLSLALQNTDLTPVTITPSLGYTSTGVPVIGELYAETVCRAWIGFVNTSNKNSDVADALGITLSLETP